MKLNRVIAVGLALVLAGLVSTPGFAAPAAKAAHLKPAPTGKVNLNTASADELTALPGVGAKLAARIVEQRQKTGPFKSTQDIVAIKGIGEKNFAKIQGYLTVGGAGR